MKIRYGEYIRKVGALILVKFTFYLVISITYVWILVWLGFRQTFDWNLSFLITISLLLFSLLFERPYRVEVVKK